MNNMHYLLISISVLLLYSHELAAQANPQTSTEYEYIFRSIQDDLKLLNTSCETYDSCAERRNEDSLQSYACHCGSYCVQLDTCCLDSPYIAVPKPKVRPVCRSVHNGGMFYMMDRCPSNDSAWGGLCEDEWNGDVDIFKIMPVTSLQTSITYKNYFCFKCHETNGDLVHWTIKLNSNATSGGYNASNERLSLKYDNSEETWLAVIGDNQTVSFPVNISIEAPQNIVPLVRDCKTDVISSCSEHWTDEEVRDQCEAYTAMKQTYRDGLVFTYRNIHCAACNFEMVDNSSCLRPLLYGYGTVSFSFTHLLDINRKDGDLVGKIQRCQEDYVWDPYANKCRKLTCALPGYRVRNGKCKAE